MRSSVVALTCALQQTSRADGIAPVEGPLSGFAVADLLS